jgi:hypothetical protein
MSRVRLLPQSSPTPYGGRMGLNGLEVRIRQGEERADVERFTRTLNRLVATLRVIDGTYTASAVRPKWVVAGLNSEGHDLVARVTARPDQRAKRSVQDMLVPVSALVQGVGLLAQGPKVPPLFVERAVTHLLEASQPVDGVQEVSLATFNGSVGLRAAVTEAVRKNAADAVQPGYVTWGSVSGVLDIVNLRSKKALKISVYDPATGRAVSGVIPMDRDQEVYKTAREALGSRVVVGGRIHRNRLGQSIRVEVERIEALGPVEAPQLNWGELLGAAPELLEGRSVDEYIGRVRSA